MYRRAPFIWTPEQPVNHQAYFQLVSREPLRRDDGCNRWFLFRRTFELPAAPGAATLNITCDGRYKLYLNGAWAGRGPARSSPYYLRYDTHDAAPLLKAGVNTACVIVHVPGMDLAWYECQKGAYQPVFGDGGLYFDLSAECSGKTLTVFSDEKWRLQECAAWNRDTPRSGWGQDFIEDFDAAQYPDGWMHADFDDSGWLPARIMRSEGTPAETATGRGPYEPFPCLLPREISQLHEAPAAPADVVWIKTVKPRPDLPLNLQLYEEELCDTPAPQVEQPAALLADDDAETIVRTAPDGDVAFMLRFDPYRAGFPFIEIDAKGGEIIEIAAGEAIPGEFDSRVSGESGLKIVNHLTCSHVFRYHARPGRQRFEKFEWTGVRALQLVVRNAPDGVAIRHVGLNRTHYPAQPGGAFSCSDPFLNRLWEIGRHTALQCMHDGWEDCPGREKRQWIGDGVVNLDIAAAAFGPSVYPLSRQFFYHAAESQRTDGLVQMFAPGDHRTDGVVIPDFTLHWIMGLRRYWLYSGDLDTVEALFPAVEKALQWFERQVDDNGLIANVPFWHFIEWAHVGRNGESCAINAMLAGALDAAEALASALSYNRAAARLGKWRARAATALNERHWNDARGLYVDEVDPATGAQGMRISQQANALMIAFDIAPQERWPGMIERLSGDDALRFTAAPPIFIDAPPFDEARHVVRANTYFCHFLYTAYAKAERFDLALEHIRRFYRPMLDAGATTLWESFEPSASLCHVFSATPVYQLSSHILGVQPLAPGFQRVRIAIQPCGMDEAEGEFATPQGLVLVHWMRAGSGVALTVEAPENVALDVAAPSGFRTEGEMRESENAGRRRLSCQFSRLA